MVKYKIIIHATVGAISESRINSVVIGNRSSLLHIQNVQLIQESTIVSARFCFL